MYYLSSTINPLLYQLMSAKFRLAFKETFKCSLFKCAILLRSNKAASSPTNSVKTGHQNHHYHNHGHPNQLRQARSSAGGAGGYQCSQTSSSQHNQHSQVAGGGQLTQLDSRLSGTSPIELNIGFANCSGYCSCCCSSCNCYALGANNQLTQSAIWEPDNSTANQQAGVMARLKGRLNRSLSGLFRMNSSYLQPDCPCCVNPVSQRSSSQIAVSQPASNRKPPRAAKEAEAATNLKTRIVSHSSAANRPVQCTIGDHYEDQCGTIKHSTSCASSPLLMGHQRSVDMAAVIHGEPLALRTASASPSNFSARTMLKFMRGPEAAAAALQPCGPLNPAGHSSNGAAMEPSIGDHQAAIGALSTSPNAGRMDRLIRPTQIEQQQQQQQLLLLQNMTSGESGNSTAGSSPDQLLLLDRSSANCSQRRRTPVSVSRSSGASHNRNRQRQKLSSWSSNGSDTLVQQEEHLVANDQAIDNPETDRKLSNGRSRRRRSSFQPVALDYAYSNGTSQSTDHSNGATSRRRRESSSSSNNDRHLSSSLSFSERHLDKKSSFSTTTSAIDCCGSYTTTNSQLTANGVNSCGSNNPSQTDWPISS
ncbi:hypothetical protein SUGI_1496570 [Cryptomeria japonica]|uniref:Uncharacterized protein n=1 Tax=Cryptomeria japonica TaxID=3369 RepID=A0AAD3NT21_CRYJA|nr:hypothetical protein SUGI_1496570 [Cryptomeria japonica]